MKGHSNAYSATFNGSGCGSSVQQGSGSTLQPHRLRRNPLDSLTSNPVHKARQRAEKASQLSGGSIMVGVSGKDSFAALDIIVSSNVFSRVEAFTMYFVKDLVAVEAPVEAVCRKYNVKLHKVPHWLLARAFKDGYLRPTIEGAHKLRAMKLKDVETHLTATTGISWFAYGDRGSDSFVRWHYTSTVDGVHPEWKRLWPIWDWKTPEVVKFLRQLHIPLPPRVAPTGGGSGFGLNPRGLKWLKDTSPSDYAKVLAVFPYAEAMLIKEAMNEQKEKR